MVLIIILTALKSFYVLKGREEGDNCIDNCFAKLEDSESYLYEAAGLFFCGCIRGFLCGCLGSVRL